MPDSAIAIGNRSAAVGGNFIGQLITGNGNRVFLGDYENLSDAYIYPGPIFEQVNLHRFVGRKWLIDIIDNFIKDQDRGYIVLEADAGFGKTAFMAWLTRTRNCPHAFFGLNPDGESQLRNLSSQIILQYDLGEKEILTPAASRCDNFYSLLERAAGKLKDSEKIIIIIDGVDEIYRTNLKSKEILWLPKVLPKGVYFIVSQRPVDVRLQIDTARTPRSIIRFSDHTDKNLEDMRLFLNEASKWPRISEVLDKSNIASDQFVESLLDRCRGVWIYLNFIIYEIEQGKRTPLNLNTLPVGLSQYYASYWSQWRDMDNTVWYNIYLPVLTTLAKIQESVTIDAVINLAKIDINPSYLRRIIKEDWRPFLTISSAGKERIRFYHATLQDFFEGEVGEEDLTSAERAFIEELKDAAKKVDNQISKYYLEAWGGLEDGLPGLNNISKQEIDEGYGLHHLSYHMFHRIANANNEEIDIFLKYIDEFLYLVSNPMWWQARRRNNPAGSGLLEDFEWAVLGSMGGQIWTLPHYILISYLKARLTSQITNLPLEILEAYAILGLSNQAIDLSYSLATIEQRSSAFFRLAAWYFNQDDFENASRLLEKVETNLREIPKNDVKPKNWADVAELYYKIGKKKKFESCLREAYEVIDSERDAAKRYRMIIKFLKTLNNWSDDQLRPILDMIKKLSDDIHVSKYHARIMMSLAKEFHRIDTAISEDIARKAIAESSPSEIKFETVDLEERFFDKNALLAENMGVLLKIGLKEIALETIETIDKKDQRINAFINLADFLISINKFPEAKKYLDQLVEDIQYQEGLPQNQIKVQIIDLLLKIDNLSKAKEIAISIPLGNIDRVSAFSMIANYLAEKGKMEKANTWIKGVGTEWGKPYCKAVIGMALAQRDPKSAYSALDEALQLSKNLTEVLVGSKNDVYTVIAKGIKNLALTNPDKSRKLLFEIIKDIQKEDGRHAIEIYSIRENRDKALYNFSSAILSVDRTCNQYVLKLSENIENSILKEEAVLLCVRAACRDGYFDHAEILLEKLEMSCWKLIAQIIIEGWKTRSSQHVRDYLESNEESISEHCNEHIPFINPLGTISLELGIADHIDVSRDIWNKRKGVIEGYENTLIKIELIYILVQNNKIENAFGLLKDLEKGYYKAEALAMIAGLYSRTNLRGAKILYKKAFKELNPEEVQLNSMNKDGNCDEALSILAGSVARWDISEANEIINKLIRKEEFRKRARGEIILAQSIKDPNEAYSELIDFIEAGAKSGLAEYWESLSFCSEALCNMIQFESIKDLLSNILKLENYR